MPGWKGEKKILFEEIFLSPKALLNNKTFVFGFKLTQPILAPREHDNRFTHSTERICRPSPLKGIPVSFIALQNNFLIIVFKLFMTRKFQQLKKFPSAADCDATTTWKLDFFWH